VQEKERKEGDGKRAERECCTGRDPGEALVAGLAMPRFVSGLQRVRGNAMDRFTYWCKREVLE